MHLEVLAGLTGVYSERSAGAMLEGAAGRVRGRQAHRGRVSEWQSLGFGHHLDVDGARGHWGRRMEGASGGGEGELREHSRHGGTASARPFHRRPHGRRRRGICHLPSTMYRSG